MYRRLRRFYPAATDLDKRRGRLPPGVPAGEGVRVAADAGAGLLFAGGVADPQEGEPMDAWLKAAADYIPQWLEYQMMHLPERRHASELKRRYGEGAG